MNQEQAIDETHLIHVLNRPAFNDCLSDVLASEELAAAFPTDQLHGLFLTAQQPPTLPSQRIYTAHHRAHPDEVVIEAGAPARFGEGWIFVVCLEFLRRNPGNPLNFEHFFGSITNVHVAAAVLRQLGQPRFLDLGAPQFGADFWRDNLVHCPTAFRFLADTLRNNVDLARTAIERQADMLMFGGERVRGNYGFAMMAVAQDGRLLEYCSMPLRGNKGVVTKACEQNVEAAAFISKDFLEDPNLLRELNKVTGVSMNNLDRAAQQDPDVIVSCISSETYRVECLPDDVAEAVRAGHLAFFAHNAGLDPRLTDLQNLAVVIARQFPSGRVWYRPVYRDVQGGQNGRDSVAYRLHRDS